MTCLQTKVWTVDKTGEIYSSYPQITQAAAFLQQDELVAFPTETVYGLGANAMSDNAVKKIYEAKGRPSDNPLIVHIATMEQLNKIATNISPLAYQLMEAFWPGPLTLILQKKQGISEIVTAGLDTVAVRMPDHPVALELIKVSQLPLAAPSANLSGRPSPTTALHVEQDLMGKIAGIIDGGPTGVGIESTVLDCTSDVPMILRPGGITKEQLEQLIGNVQMDAALTETKVAPKSPGMKYTHYAPKAPLTIIEGSPQFIQQLINEQKQRGKRVGVLTTEEHANMYEADYVVVCGSRGDLESVAHHLYDSLREFDKTNVEIIYSESFPVTGIGQAVMNRLMKAAGHQLITEK